MKIKNNELRLVFFLSMVIIHQLLFLSFFPISKVFAQQDPTITAIDELRLEINEIRLLVDRSEVAATVGAIIAAAIGIMFSTVLNWKSLKSFQKTAEADLFLRLNEAIYRSKEGIAIIEAMIKSKETGEKILEPKGKIPIRHLENFLNEVQAACMLTNQKLISSGITEPGFVWVIRRVRENAEIMEHIHKAQQNYGYYSYGEITKYKFNEYFEDAKFFNSEERQSIKKPNGVDEEVRNLAQRFVKLQKRINYARTMKATDIGHMEPSSRDFSKDEVARRLLAKYEAEMKTLLQNPLLSDASKIKRAINNYIRDRDIIEKEIAVLMAEQDIEMRINDQPESIERLQRSIGLREQELRSLASAAQDLKHLLEFSSKEGTMLIKPELDKSN